MNLNIKNLRITFLRNLKRYQPFIYAVILYLLYFYIFHHDEPNCLVKRFTGYPCPGCGMSRASISLLTFQFGDAFMYHPFVFIMPLLFIVVFFKGIRIIDKLFYSKVFWGLILVIYVSIYIIRMIHLYPDVVPMDHYTALLQIH